MISNTSQLLHDLPQLATQVLQFADDTLILTLAHPNNLKIIRRILSNFSTMSGLQINYTKSGCTPIAIPATEHQKISSIMGCPLEKFPITYLGLPLMVNKPKTRDFQPLIDKTRKALAGWKGKFLSLAGRLTLLNSVLNSIPLYYMQAFLLPTGTIQQIQTIARQFLWRGEAPYSGGHCLIKWGRVCLPKRHGGLGVLDMTTQNKALLLKWLWILSNQPASPWTTFIRSAYGITTLPVNTTQNTHYSFFLKDLISLAPIFQTSTRKLIGNGSTTSFWEDTWLTPTSLKYSYNHLYHISNQPNASVNHTLADTNLCIPYSIPPSFRQTLAELHSIVSTTNLTDAEDITVWRWTAKAIYDAKSAYNFLINPGMSTLPSALPWNIKAPPKVKIFLWIMLQEKLLTAENLIKRQCPALMHCVGCNQQLIEDTHHLFLTCPFAKTIWMRLRPDTPTALLAMPDVHNFWDTYRCTLSSSARRAWDTLFAATIWNLWKERNARIFRQATSTPYELQRVILRDWDSWGLNCK